MKDKKENKVSKDIINIAIASIILNLFKGYYHLFKEANVKQKIRMGLSWFLLFVSVAVGTYQSSSLSHPFYGHEGFFHEHLKIISLTITVFWIVLCFYSWNKRMKEETGFGFFD